MPSPSPARQWLLLAAVWLIVGSAIGWNLYTDRNAIDTLERQRLSDLAKVIDENLGLQLLAANLALNSLRADLPLLTNQKDSNTLVNRRLKSLSDAMPGVRTLLILDAEGKVLASDRAELLGQDFREREYFRIARRSGNPDTLFVSPPFKTALGVFAMNLVKIIPDEKGGFDRLISATLDPDFFHTLLSSVHYAPDMWTALTHADGKLFLIVPPRPGIEGTDIAQPGSFHARHRESGQKATIMTGIDQATGENAMVALRTINIPEAGMDNSLLTAVGRDVTSIFALWRRHANEQTGLFVLLVLASTAGLVLYQRRQRAYEHLAASKEADRQRAEAALVESEERYRTAFVTSPDAISINRLTDGLYLEVNEGFTRLVGWTAEEVLGKSSREINVWHDIDHRQRLVEALKRDGFCRNLEAEFVRKDGKVITALVSGHVMTVNGEPCILSVTRDITERKEAEDRINHLAFFDPLTLLPNRRLLLDRLQQALASSARNKREGAILFIDLDNFKTLNDTLGHDTGDSLLRQVAQRLTTCIREGDTVARLGGDEFVVMLEDLSETIQEAANQAEIVGEKILATLNLPYPLAGHEHRSTPSIGITLFADHQDSTDELLKRADLAMYQAKAAGRNTMRFFDPEMQAVVNARAALEADLREGVLKGQFLLHYQPQVSGDGRITGCEVLIRWQHPRRGLVSPAEFIPLAEETGLILPLGQWVLETACTQLARWLTETRMAHLSVAVNVSACQFRQAGFVDQVLAILDSTGANPRQLKLELTEGLLLDDVEDVIAKMTALKAKGVCFSLDDFGTGYSSLSYLKRLPLDQLKIDQSFVKDILTDPSDTAIARTIVALAQNLGLAVIAEGVETAEQRDCLAAHGCDAYQGFFYGRPGSVEEFELRILNLDAQGGRPGPEIAASRGH